MLASTIYISVLAANKEIKAPVLKRKTLESKQGNEVFLKEIGAIEALEKEASSSNDIASKYAAQALRHKLSQQVPSWEPQALAGSRESRDPGIFS